MRVLLFVNGQVSWSKQFRTALDEVAKNLELDGSGPSITIVDRQHGAVRQDGDVVVYFCPPLGQPAPSVAEGLLAAGFVVPVVETEDDAQRLPEALKPYNAIVCDRFASGWAAVLADSVVASALLPRSERRVFISYRRLDATGVATQLADALTARGTDAFLDSRSIELGADFQEVLMERLLDVDTVVYLASPESASSKWITDELVFANRATIGVLAVAWPDDAFPQDDGEPVKPDFLRARLLDADQVVQLAPTDLTPGDARVQQLTDAALARVMERVTRFRARAVAQRLETIYAELWDDYAKLGYTVTPGDRLGVFDLRKDGEPESLLQVVPCVPDLDIMHGLTTVRPNAFFIYAYREHAPNSARARALAWALDTRGRLDVRALDGDD